MSKKTVSKVMNSGSVNLITPQVVFERVVEINNPEYRVDTLDGPVYFEKLNEAIEVYNNDPTAYAFSAEDTSKPGIEFQLLLFVKNIPFPADIRYLRSLSIRLMLIIEMFNDNEDLLARSCISDELSMFNRCYHFSPQLMDEFRFDLLKNLLWLQELGLNGNISDIRIACETIAAGIKQEISPFIYRIDSKEECVPDPMYALSDDVIEKKMWIEIEEQRKSGSRNKILRIS